MMQDIRRELGISTFGEGTLQLATVSNSIPLYFLFTIFPFSKCGSYLGHAIMVQILWADNEEMWKVRQ